MSIPYRQTTSAKNINSIDSINCVKDHCDFAPILLHKIILNTVPVYAYPSPLMLCTSLSGVLIGSHPIVFLMFVLIIISEKRQEILKL